MRKLQSYVSRYGPEIGPRLYHVLQSQAGHASVAARLRRKLDATRERGKRPLPLFDGSASVGLVVSLAAAPLLPPGSP